MARVLQLEIESPILDCFEVSTRCELNASPSSTKRDNPTKLLFDEDAGSEQERERKHGYRMMTEGADRAKREREKGYAKIEYLLFRRLDDETLKRVTR